ncbi:MAG: hypothetical protein IT210_20640 [Armatimonadetes bacterium]|nr:hypothetical protein [Armatimonadota bacterium]
MGAISKQTLDITVFCLLSVLIASATSANQSSGKLFLHKRNERVYLMKDNARLLIMERDRWPGGFRRNAAIRLSGGYGITTPLHQESDRSQDPNPQIIIFKDRKPYGMIVLRQVLEQWLKDDHLWGGHQSANQTRYKHRSAGGVSGFIHDAVPLGQSVFALITWYALGPSARPVLAQHLARIRVQPQPVVVPLRQLLDVEAVWSMAFSMEPIPRLFTSGKRLLYYTKPGDPDWIAERKVSSLAELLEITPDGKTVGVYDFLSSNLPPIGRLEGRWLVLGESDGKTAQPFWIYDLRTKKISPLPGSWKGYSAENVYLSASGRRILMGKRWASSKDYKAYIVTVPEGRRVPLLPNPTGYPLYYLWQNMIVLYNVNKQGQPVGVSVYSASTGRRIRQLKLKEIGFVLGKQGRRC